MNSGLYGCSYHTSQMCYYPSYEIDASLQPLVVSSLETLSVSSITEETMTARYVLDGEKAIVEDKRRSTPSNRRSCHLSIPDFIWVLRSRAAAVFLIKLDITEQDFCTYIVPGCSRYGQVFGALWPIIHKTLSDWTYKIFDLRNLDAEVLLATNKFLDTIITKRSCIYVKRNLAHRVSAQFFVI